MKLEGPKFRLWLAPNITVEERAQAAHALFRHLIDPPRAQVELRRVAVRTALAQFEGSRTGRAKLLEQRYRKYLAGAWPRERGLVELPFPRSTERVCLHRLARLNAPSSWRQLHDIANRANCP